MPPVLEPEVELAVLALPEVEPVLPVEADVAVEVEPVEVPVDAVPVAFDPVEVEPVEPVLAPAVLDEAVLDVELVEPAVLEALELALLVEPDDDVLAEVVVPEVLVAPALDVEVPCELPALPEVEAVLLEEAVVAPDVEVLGPVVLAATLLPLLCEPTAMSLRHPARTTSAQMMSRRCVMAAPIL